MKISNRPSLSVNLILVIFSILLSIGIAEIVCRIIQITNDTDPTYKLAHEVLPFVMKPNSESVSHHGHLIKINSHGLRDYEYPYEKADGVFRVLVLGGSLAFAYGIDVDDGFAKVLERRFNAIENKNYNKIEVINSAHVSFDTADEFNYLRLYGLRYSPDLLIVSTNSTDFTTQSVRRVIHGGVDSAPGSIWLRLHIPGWVKRIIRKSHLYAAVVNGFAELRYKWKGQPDTFMPEEEKIKTLGVTKDNFDRIVSLASNNKLPVCFITVPQLIEVTSKTYDTPPEFHQQIRDIEKEGMVFHVDAMESFINYPSAPIDLFAVNDPSHPNAIGHGLIADLLYDQLVSHVL